MTMYLLLRNNKQSGPYSFEDLKNMGLKAYDLVWLEGKSAAWRYPSEIEELKEFAPAVEEQPFDRFYKKPVATTASTSGEPSVMTGKRIIYVTLPAGRPAPAPVREAPIQVAPREMPRQTEGPRISVPEPATPVSAIPAIGDYPSQYDRRETSRVEFAPRRRPRNNDRLMKIMAVGLCILALLAAGIFIGLSLNKETLGLQKRIASRTTPPLATPASAAVQSPPTPAGNSSVPSTGSGKAASAVNGTTGLSTVDEKAGSPNDAASPTSGKRTRRQKGKDKVAVAVMPPVQKDSALADIPVVTREAVHRTVTEPSAINNNEAAKTALTSEVSVGANGYNVGTFGGINDLQLTVTNRSAHPLDLVVVEVKYIQANKKVYKTENLNFHDIGAGSALMQEAPKSSRGIRVQYRIVSISSKEMGLSYSGL